ncbi:MAG: histidine phosphatase family protein, partial [Actinomycetota bacterium]|nr:histidine phosphatase family protein [Actinomycetota bacterium]
MRVRLLLIRHGQSDLSSRDFVQSARGRQWDPPLSEAGREQASRLSGRLVAMEEPAAVYASPFRRCRETIRPYLEATGIPARFLDDLGEVFTGEWEGKNFEEIISGDEELARKFRDQEAMFSLAPGGESGQQLRTRVVPAIEATLAGVEKGAVIVVAHGGVINAYLGHIMALSHDMFFLPENSSINTVWV